MNKEQATEKQEKINEILDDTDYYVRVVRSFEGSYGIALGCD